METIKRINREALREAQEALDAESNNNRFMVVGLAVLVGLAVYYLVKNSKVELVMKVDEHGIKIVDNRRAALMGVLAGLLVLAIDYFRRN